MWRANEARTVLRYWRRKFERGEVSTKEFFQVLTASCKFLQSSRCTTRAWNALLGELNDHTLFLKKLAEDYSLALVSNTNVAHIDHIKQESGPFLWNTFTEKFDALFLSYEMGCRKPDTEYYDRVLEAMGALPEEVLFIDDTQAKPRYSCRDGHAYLVVQYTRWGFGMRTTRGLDKAQ